MKFPLKIETHDKKLGFEITAANDSLHRGSVIEAPGGAKIEYQGTYVRKGLGIPEILEFIVEASITVDLGLFSAWLYDKLKDRPVEKITIRHKEITEITQDNIRKTIEKEININD